MANVKAIDWTLEFLSRTCVKEVIIVSSTENAQMIEEHLKLVLLSVYLQVRQVLFIFFSANFG